MDVKTAKNAILLVGPAGGSVSILDENGEVIATEGLQAGRYKTNLWVPFMTSEGDALQFDGEVSPLVPSGARVKRIQYGEGSHDSGANPEFTVTSADRMARELERKLGMLDKTTNKIERRMAQLNELSRRKGVNLEVAKEEDADVIDNTDDGDNGPDVVRGNSDAPDREKLAASSAAVAPE